MALYRDFLFDFLMSIFEESTQNTSGRESELIACHQCDLLVEVTELEEGSKAHCPRCSHQLLKKPKGGVSRPLALSIAALGLFGLSNAFPFMSFKGGAGQEQMITLCHNVMELYRHDSQLLALTVFGLVIVLPCLYLVATILILVPMAKGQRHPNFPRLAKLVFALAPWVMVDVFLLGILVSLTKISSMAKVEIGLSFISFAFFAATFSMVVSSMNKEWLWRAWERLETK
ncbi:paraquat-inducible protein A [Puniceicoccaceae bacterium K14]|nr:paraquat-inducible protein A [Puniceicoccaceae bacterium K14]